MVACESTIDEQDDEFGDDEPITEALDNEQNEFDDEQDAFDDEAEEPGEELDDAQEDAKNEEDSAEFLPATIEEFEALLTDQLGYDLDALDDEALLDVVQQELGFDSAEETGMYLADLFGDEFSEDDEDEAFDDNEDDEFSDEDDESGAFLPVPDVVPAPQTQARLSEDEELALSLIHI